MKGKDEMINMLLGICYLALVVFNIFLYHKIFDVVYFDLGQGLLKEVVGAFLVAALEIGLIVSVGKWILGNILKILGIGLKFIIIIVGIIIIAYAIYYIYGIFKKKQNIAHKENTLNNSDDDNKAED